MKTKSAPALLGGPYEPPSCRVGDWLDDEVHGRAKVNGFTTAPISWPTRKRANGGPRTLLITEVLARAIRLESAIAVAHWWGISTKTVRVFRRELDTPRNTKGTLQRHATVAVPPPPPAAAKGRARIAADPEIRHRIAQSQREKTATPETRQRLSEAHRGKPKPPGWGARASAWMQQAKAERK